MQPSSGNGSNSLRKRTARPGFLWASLDLFSSVWLGITLLTLLFFYCSIGSALPQVRQLPGLEMTEFEWFHWWPFDLLLALFCLNLIVVTVRRIPLRRINAGVWTIHAGIITLAIGSYIYFGTKVEGDAPVFRRSVKIEMPGLADPVTLLALPGNQTSVVVGPDVWRFQIQSTNTDWPILSDEHKGEKAHAINVGVTPPQGEGFVRQLLAGYPQYTEDVVPGQGRAIKSLGRKLVDENLKLTLDYEPTTWFHLMHSWALYVRPVGQTEWVERPIEGLPRYNDYIASREQVFYDPHVPLPIRPIDLIVPPGKQPDALHDVPVHITGYLRYAQMQSRWREGGPRLNPVLQVTTLGRAGTTRLFELSAFDRAGNRTEEGLIEFRWLGDRSQLAELPAQSRAVLGVKIPGTEVDLQIPLSRENVVGRDGAFTPILGSDYSFRVLRVEDGLSIPTSGRLISIAMVEIESPAGRVTRMVADDPALSRDLPSGGDPHAPAATGTRATDPAIEMTYVPWASPLIFAAYPGGLHLVFNDADGRRFARDVALREAVDIIPGEMSVRVDNLLTNAVSDVRPYVVPPAQRERDAGEIFAKIRLELGTGDRGEARWLNFNLYAFEDEQYARTGRFAYLPERFRLADGREVEVMFSRRRLPLPNPIVLEDFALDTHLGGYTGSSLTIRNYVSRLRFLDGGQWTEPTAISVNSPTEYGGYWYFQSTWDPPSGGPGSGMNHTGLGVGNRNGVYVQLAGCCLAVAGMIYAFYVKPVIKRRRQLEAQAKVGRSAPPIDDDIDIAADDAITGDAVIV